MIITDTVGFIRDLPKDLMAAFRATLEELENADLLLHVIDIGNPAHQEQIQAVTQILEELGLGHIPQIRVLNKQDQVNREALPSMVNALDGIAVSANDRKTLMPLILAMQARVSMSPKEPLLDVDSVGGRSPESP